MKIPFLSQFFKSRDKPKNYYIGTDFRFKGERWGVHLHSWLESYLIRGGGRPSSPRQAFPLEKPVSCRFIIAEPSNEFKGVR